MLYVVIFSIFLFSFNELRASCSQAKSCPVHLQEDYLKIVEGIQKDKAFQSFLTEASQKKDILLESKEFQELVTTLEAQPLTHLPQLKHQSDLTNQPGELTIFVSFSLGEKALLNLAQEAKRWNATLVLRGFIEGSYAKTVKALHKIILKTMSSGDRPGEGQGFLIDPELFSLFHVKAVPTYILSKPFQLNAHERTQTPLHDRIQGHVSLQYALERFAKEGDLQTEAQMLLKREGVK